MNRWVFIAMINVDHTDDVLIVAKIWLPNPHLIGGIEKGKAPVGACEHFLCER